MPFLDISVAPVPVENKSAYLEHARATTPLFKEYGAIAVTECWGEDIADGQLTDFKKAVLLQDGESIAVSWVTWPDRAARDAGWEKLMQDDRMMQLDLPFDGKRMIFAGFDMIQDS